MIEQPRPSTANVRTDSLSPDWPWRHVLFLGGGSPNAPAKKRPNAV